jgi:hypothetical protein
MHYVIKEGISPDLVADADSLMKELYRADGGIRNLDQNNIRSSGINFDTTEDPGAGLGSDRGCTRTHQDTPSDGILYAEFLPIPSGTFGVAGKWYTTGSLSFTIPTTTPFSIYVSGQLSGPIGNDGPARYGGVIYGNGQILGVEQTFSAAITTDGSTIKLPFFLTATALLPAGDWTLSTGFRQWTSTFGSVLDIELAAIGYAR